MNHLNFAKVHFLSELDHKDCGCILNFAKLEKEKFKCGDYRLGHSVHEGHGEEEDEGFHQ